jgi:type II secretory pathway pseudopilin PulG
MNGRAKSPLRIVGSRNGFTYLSALVFVAIMGIALNTAGGFWSSVMKREREQELLFAGDQIRKAIESYHKYAPGGRVPEYPRSLEDLLKDPRYPSVKRHLRRIYRNPMSKDGKWEYVLDKRAAIKGVFANSQEQPTKKARFPDGYESFEKAAVYADWKFTQGLDQQGLLRPNLSPAGVAGDGAKGSVR